MVTLLDHPPNPKMKRKLAFIAGLLNVPSMLIVVVPVNSMTSLRHASYVGVVGVRQQQL